MVAPNAAPTVAIVGGGAVGTALLAGLVDRLTSEAPLRAQPRVVLFEKGERVGPGLAYARDASPYLLNQSAQTMSLVPGRRADFCAWLAARDAGATTHEELFCRRELFGDYVEDCGVRALDKARRRGLVVTTIHDEVTSLVRRSGGYRVVSRAHAPLDADVVILALGNLPTTRFRALEGPGFVASPYPSAAMCARVPKDARVGILGSGLSAIDAALALFAAGHTAPITMASRSGLLPAVRGPLLAHELRHVTRANIARATDHGRRPLRWRTVLAWLEAECAECGVSIDWERDFAPSIDPLARASSEVAAAERGARTWQSIGEALNPMIEIVWNHLHDDDKRVFLDRAYSRFMSHWVPIPLVTGRRVAALLREGRLRVERLTSVHRSLDTNAYEMRFHDRIERFDAVVNATGAPRHLADYDSPLLHSLASHGIVAAHDCGGVRVDFDSLRVLGRDGRADPALFAIGNLTSGTHLFTSTLEFNVEKAARIASLLASELHRAREREHHVDAPSHST